MSVEPTTVSRPSLRLRADVPDRSETWPSVSTRSMVLVLGAFFVLLGGASQDLGPVDARLGLASGEALGPYGRVFGYWDPTLWPITVMFGRVWGFFEEAGPTQNAVRWPAAIAGMLIGVVLARRVRLTVGPRAGVLAALAWYGSMAMMDRSASMGLDVVAGLGTIAALDRLLSRGAGWAVGPGRRWRFWRRAGPPWR